MRTRSQARNRNRRQQQLTTVIVEEPEFPMADNRTMAQMLQAPIEGYEDAIVVPPINANNFELKQPLINLVKVISLRTVKPEIGLLHQCPHHGFSELHQLDTFYDALNTNDQDALDSAMGGNFLDKMPRDAIMNAPSSTSSPSDNSFEIQQMAALLEDKMNIRMSRLEKAISKKNATTPATVKESRRNQSRYQGNNFNSNQNRGGNFNQNRQNNQGAVYQAPPYQPPTNQPLVNQALPPVSQIQGVSKTDFESYAKANDANMNNLQMKLDNFQRNQNDFQRSYNDSQKKQDDFQNLMLGFMQNYHNNSTASTSRPGTLPSQTVTNPRQQINAITTRSEIGLKYALVEMPKFNEWLSSLLRNKEKLEEIAITTVNAECSAIIMNKVPKKLKDPGKFLIPGALQGPNRTSALADSGASINLLPHSIYKKLGLEALTPTRMTLELANRSITHPMGIAEDVVIRVDGFTFLADFVVVNFKPDPRVPIILGRPFLRTAKALIDLYEETLTLRVGKEELVYYADKSEKNKEKNFVHAISIIDFLKDDPFSGSTTNNLPPSSSLMKTSDNLEKFADELAPLDSLPWGNNDSTLKKDFHEETFQTDKDARLCLFFPLPLTSPEESEFKAYLERDSISTDSDSPFIAELSASVTLNSLGNEDKLFKPGILVYHTIHDKNLVTLEENLKENISSGTLLVFKEPSFLLPPPEPPDDFLNFEPNLVMKNVMLNEDFYQSKKTLSLNVEDVNSFTFIIWIFLPHFTYPEESPLIFSFRSTDISKITRKPSKTGKHGHENGRVYKSRKQSHEKVNPQSSSQRKVKPWSTELKQMAPNPNTIHPSSSFHQAVKTKGFLQLRGTEVYSRAPKHNGKVNSVKSRAIISHSNNEAHVSLKKAHMDVGFALISLRKETQVSLKRIASLAIRVRSLSDLTAQNVDPMIG
ncbi:reverse transcriptase domain-containing protein [Tanacetum coccineum]